MVNSIKKLGNKLILFETAKMNNEMMSSVLLNILGGGLVEICPNRNV